MSDGFTHVAASAVAAFLASLVEAIEALTVVLAIGATRGWTGALAGTGIGLGVLLVLVVVFGSALTLVPLELIQLVIGVLLLLFGLRWLRKAILRSAGAIPLHDEEALYASELRRLGGNRTGTGPWDRVAVAGAFKIVMLEGVEVIFIVIAIGANGGLLVPAAGGALAALVVVSLLGLALHRPVASIPENVLKFVVGILLCAFGTFWTGEGLGATWPGADWSLLGLVIGYAVVALVAARLGEPGWRSAGSDATVR